MQSSSQMLRLNHVIKESQTKYVLRKEIFQVWLQTITVGGEKCLNVERFFIIRSEVGENDVCLEGLGGYGGILLDTSADGIGEKAQYKDFAAAHDEARLQMMMNMRLRILLLARK